MLSKENLEEFTKKEQTSLENIVREYCQHLFLSFLYQQPDAEKLLFKGGTALRIIFKSPRYSEGLDFTGYGLAARQVEELFTNALSQIQKTGIDVEIIEGKPTTGGYLGIAVFDAYGRKTNVQIEVSLRKGKPLNGERILIQNEYLPAYTLVSLSREGIIEGKIAALLGRQKPRDFYDYYFLLSGNYPITKDGENLSAVLKLLKNTKINFKAELKKFLPKSHWLIIRDFSAALEREIKRFI